MLSVARPGFAHRLNPNDTTDSICLKCFRTIATKGTKAELADSESAHECDGLNLAYTLYPEDQLRGPFENVAATPPAFSRDAS
jgi:hypothetical protein